MDGFDKICDDALTLLYDMPNRAGNPNTIMLMGASKGKNYSEKDIELAMSRLIKDGQASRVANTRNHYKITHTGIAFLTTNSYVKQAVEQNRANEKTEIELKLNRYLYKARWLPHILALLAIIISLIALLKN